MSRALAFVAVVASAGMLWAGEPNVPPEGFVALFNGEDLSGLVTWGGKSPAASWRVIDGCLRNVPGGKEPLMTQKTYGDYVLLVDFRLGMPEVNSGVILSRGPQVDISLMLWKNRALEKKLAGGEEVDKWYIGVVEGHCDPKDQETREAARPSVAAGNPVGEWNTYKITKNGSLVRVELNGVLVHEREVRITKTIPDKSPIALQYPLKKPKVSDDPNYYIEYRNIFVKVQQTKRETGTEGD